MASGSVELHGITKRFEGASRPAVQRVDLAIAPGERFVIVGPSGSGKTTILRLVAGLETATSGTIHVGGTSAEGVAPRDRGVAMVFQQPAVYPHLSVFDNLAFGLRARRVKRSEVKERVTTMADWLGLADLLKRRPKTLSGGEVQRVALGRAAVTQPAVLLLDEPFSSLDAPLRASTRSTLLDLHKRLGGTLILVTHDQTEAMAIGDRIALMRAGRVEAIGTPRDLYNKPSSPFVAGFLGDPPMSFLPCRVTENLVEIPNQSGVGQALTLENRLELPSGTGLLGLRPEAIAIGPGESGVLAVPAIVERVELRGHESIVFLRVAGHLVAARIKASKHVEAGIHIPIHFQPENVRFFAQDV